MIKEKDKNKIIYKYYEGISTQVELAKEYGVSNAYISRLLTKAKENGTVKCIYYFDKPAEKMKPKNIGNIYRTIAVHRIFSSDIPKFIKNNIEEEAFKKFKNIDTEIRVYIEMEKL